MADHIVREINTLCQLSFQLQIDRIEELTNGNILELCSKMLKTKITFNDLAELFKYPPSSLRGDVSVLRKKVQSIRGDKKINKLNEKFFKIRQPCASTSVASTSQSELFTELSHKAEVESLNSTITTLKSKINTQNKKMCNLERSAAELRCEKRKLKRQCTSKQAAINTKRTRYNELMMKVRKFNERREKEKTTRVEVKSLKRKINYLERTVKHVGIDRNKTEVTTNEQNTYIQKLEMENDLLKTETTQLKESLTYTETLLDDCNNNNNNVLTFDEERNCYTTDVQLCFMNLLSEGVGVHHVNNVIREVAHLCEKNVPKLPSVTTINRIADQRASMSYMQLNEQLKDKPDTTLQSDETRKHGECFEVFSVRDPSEKTWVLGLKDMQNKSSDNCLQTLKTIIDDISQCTSTNAGQTILANIRNTMSDRAATERKFHQLLEAYREEILPACYSNWESLSIAEQESISQMNNFYCGLHLLVNFAEVADKIIKKFEDSVKDGDLGAEAHYETKSYARKTESSSVRLVRTASKALARGGDDKSGCYGEFRTFLNEKDEERGKKKSSASRLERFRGNRFNILFYNSEVLFYLADDIIEFLEKVHLPKNLLQKSVYYDIKENLLLAVLKALGICSKLVTAPLWRALEDKDCSLEKANSVYQCLFNFLEDGMQDATNIVCGRKVPFPELIKKDDIYNRLMQADDCDILTSSLLEQIFAAWHTLVRKAAGDHLSGGKFSSVSESLCMQTQSVPRHNKFPERVFAFLDALTRFRPVASTLCNECYIMYSLNKTGEWIKTLSNEEKNNFLDLSRKEGKEIRERYIKRVKDIEKAKREILNKKRLAIKKKEEDEYKRKEGLINDILFYGLWQYPETVDSQLATIKTEQEKKKALKCQLIFRHKILGQPGEKTLFQFSEKGKQFSVEKLALNNKVLIRNALQMTPDQQQNIFCGKNITHYQIVDNVRTPFKGRVISTVPGYPNWYNVVYEKDPAVYVYNLNEDYKAGDLLLDIEENITEVQQA